VRSARVRARPDLQDAILLFVVAGLAEIERARRSVGGKSD
jgi:hypothetical protein